MNLFVYQPYKNLLRIQIEKKTTLKNFNFSLNDFYNHKITDVIIMYFYFKFSKFLKLNCSILGESQIFLKVRIQFLIIIRFFVLLFLQRFLAVLFKKLGLVNNIYKKHIKYNNLQYLID